MYAVRAISSSKHVHWGTQAGMCRYSYWLADGAHGDWRRDASRIVEVCGAPVRLRASRWPPDDPYLRRGSAREPRAMLALSGGGCHGRQSVVISFGALAFHKSNGAELEWWGGL
jgi:hypothetical protein